MSASLSPEEIRAAAEVHDELGPGYRDAVIESFLDKVGREIDERVDKRLAVAPPGTPARRERRHPDASLGLAIASLIFGIPISAIAVAAGRDPAGLAGLLVVWAAIAVINVAYNLSHSARRQPPDHR